MEDNLNDKPSLFPSSGLFAAANLNEDNEEKSSKNEQNWLNNKSFKKDVNVVNKIEDDDESADKEPKKRKHKKEKKKKSKKSRTRSPDRNLDYDLRDKKYEDNKYKDNKYKDDKYNKSSDKKSRDDKKYEKELNNQKIENELFKIDRRSINDNLLYDSLYAGDVPKYKLNESKSLKYKSNKVQRYFNVKLSKGLHLTKLYDKTINENSTNFIKLVEKDVNELINEEKFNKLQESNITIDLTEEIKYDNEILFSKIKEFNSHLNQNPNDIDKWIEFIKFQDELKFELEENDLRKDKTVNNVNLFEKKLLVLEKALKLNSNNVKLMILKLELLKEQMEVDKLNDEWNNLIFIYPTNFEIIKNYLKFIATHISYFNVSNLNKFFSKYMNKIVQYQEGHLKSIRNSVSSNQSIENSMLQVLLLYTILLKQTGFIEKSIAIWQSIIEFNFNRPDFLNREDLRLDDLKEYFEVFWSSGCSRFGEKQSLGWMKVINKSTDDNLIKLDKDNKLNNDKLLNDKENEIVLNFKNDRNRVWFEIELLREKYNWISAKLHEDCDDLDHTVLFEDISDCLFKFKDKKSYQNCLIYFLYYLNAIKLDDIKKLEINLPTFYLDNEEQFLNIKNSKLLAPKYFNYDQRLKFIIMVYQQSMNLMESRNLENYHQLVYYYLNFIIQNIKQLDKEKSRKLFKKILKNPLNCNKIIYWKIFVDLEIQLNELTSAKKIYSKILEMLINQSDKESTKSLNGNLSIIHDFIEFNLRINNVKLNMIDNNFKFNNINEEKEIGKEILCFIYSILNSKKIDNLKDINSILQLRTKQKIEKQFTECLEQVLNLDSESTNQLTNCSINNLIYLIVLQIYNYYFYSLLNQSSDSSIKSLNKTSKFINEQLIKLKKSIKSKLILNYLIENLYIKHLDLHLLFLKFNFSCLTSFNNLLNQAIKQFPKNTYLLTLLVETESFRIINGQIEKFTIKLCQKIYETNIEQWLFVIYFEMQRLSNIQQQSIVDLVNSFNSKNQDVSRVFDHTGTYSTGLAIRIRNLFEKALQVHNCVLLWRLYMHFEVNQNNLDYAKTIFYRALQQCPWNKLLYMDGVKIFTMNMTMKQPKNLNKSKLIQNVHNLNDVLDLMIEKQLRVRTAVEEVEFLVDNQANLS